MCMVEFVLLALVRSAMKLMEPTGCVSPSAAMEIRYNTNSNTSCSCIFHNKRPRMSRYGTGRHNTWHIFIELDRVDDHDDHTKSLCFVSKKSCKQKRCPFAFITAYLRE